MGLPDADVSSPTLDKRPSLLFLGDSRLRWIAMWHARCVCDHRLQLQHELGAPHLVNSTAALDEAMDGVANWRSGGGYLCSSRSSLREVAYYVHYGVSSTPPYLRNTNTWHHPHDYDAQAPTSSTRGALAAVRQLLSLLPPTAPVVIVLSSFLWDIGRLMKVHA